MRTSLFCLLIVIGIAHAQLHADVLQCDPSSPHMFKFLGNNIVNLNENQIVTFESFCFKSNKATFAWKTATDAVVTIESHDKRNLFCTDAFVITSMMEVKMETKFWSGKTTYEFKFKTPEDQAYVRGNGIVVVPLCDKLRHIIPDVIDTAAMFADKLGNALPKWLQTSIRKKNYKRLEELTGAKSVTRKVKQQLSADWLDKNVQSGDVYCEYGGDSVAVTIVFGTGGVCNHVGMFLRGEDGVLYAVESNPPSITMYKATDKIKVNSKDDSNFVILMLDDENRAKFDVKKAWATARSYMGVIYGWDNIVFSFWDTPENSFTQLANAEILMTYIAFLEKIPATKDFASQLVNEALNHRLGTTGLSFPQILDTLGQRKMTIGQLGQIPEDPNWTYGADKGKRYICSAFVTRLLIDAGVFGSLDIKPHEMTPNDVYNFKIWRTSKIPAECTLNDPYLPYCQVTGSRALLPFKWWNAIAPYSHMNEHCPSIAPLYERPAGC